jgi:hypothetical protein
VAKWVERIEQDSGNLQAPARHWPEGRVRRIYLDYFSVNGALAQAASELPKIARRSLREAAIGSALLGRAWSRKLVAKARSGKSVK